jgi:glycosyltransferase involved in cell wall biosynthesis
MKTAIVVPMRRDDDCISAFEAQVYRNLPEAAILYIRDPNEEGVHVGEEACILEGITQALMRGYDYIAIMDVDLQDPPALLPTMLYMVRNCKYDVAWPIHNETEGHSLLYRIGALTWYLYLSLRSYGRIPFHAGNFCLMNRSTAARVIESKIPFVRKAIAMSAMNGVRKLSFARPERGWRQWWERHKW